MTTRQYQNLVTPALQERLPDLKVIQEWIAFRGYRNQYSPRVDIAVGPFSVADGENQIVAYNQIIHENNTREFLHSIYDLHQFNTVGHIPTEMEVHDFEWTITKNRNARCLLSIEVENKNSKKHFMGSLINAASLGRVGIGVAFDDAALRTFVRIVNYLGFLKRVDKNTYDTTNFFLVTKQQFADLLGVEL